ncbi:hypothetical protein OBBRIDRAFT_761400 [Obba rivulosa]|uniref:Uncharacterized protein n=1 Tax=Obba rivulosa TaxID=1052685 RepID=A0A8E2DFW0_9APHY|nr:hypothetical protein OBBRIDRAFT_761400 [Obba rivulosa]
MDRLCDEIIQLILNELNDPTNLSLVSKRYYSFTQDPYVRASYFLSRYGRIQAYYWALGRGRLMTNQVIDILFTSGAHLSRYLVQCAIHHYFRTQVPFIKTPWVRTIPFPVFMHFLEIAGNMYGDIPRGKGEDDGTIFLTLLANSRFLNEHRSGKWETMRDAVEKYKFIPFCHKDPLMSQFPLVLAIEPRLLPYARANGFYMDRKYRDFVFRKMFEKPAVAYEGRMEEIVRNVQELSRLDSNMFLSRTVAAEVCMEAKTNESAYIALKRLDKEGVLKFELSAVVEELTKLFVNTRSVSHAYTYNVMRELRADFPSQDPTVRLVLLLTVFLAEPLPYPEALSATVYTSPSLRTYVRNCKEKAEGMNLAPVTRKDLYDVLLNQFTPDRCGGILQYGQVELGMGNEDLEQLVRDVAISCLEIGSKGKMLQQLVRYSPSIEDVISAHVVSNYRIDVDDLPPYDDEKACANYQAKLCRAVMSFTPYSTANDYTMDIDVPTRAETQSPGIDGEVEDSIGSGSVLVDDARLAEGVENLGRITQDTLTTMIRKDEVSPVGRRRRYYGAFSSYTDHAGKLTYPAEFVDVGRWAWQHFGSRSAVAATFMTHAVLNGTVTYIQPLETFDTRTPLTLKHFKMLARLARAPETVMYEAIELGANFYFSEEDYVNPATSGEIFIGNQSWLRNGSVKSEGNSIPVRSGIGSETPRVRRRDVHGVKRPRRSATTSVKSYTVPDSDDEAIMDEDDVGSSELIRVAFRKVESHMQRWVKHLTLLLKDEQKKYNEKKRHAQAAAPVGTKIRVPKSEFLKSLAHNLPRIRKLDEFARQHIYGDDTPGDDYSEGEDDEYIDRSSRSKRRKVGD